MEDCAKEESEDSKDSIAEDFGSSMADGRNIITKEMLKEEQALEKKNQKEFERMRRKFEAEEHEEELKELRYKRLLNLLKKSQFYSKFIQAKIEEKLQVHKENENAKKWRQKKRPMLDKGERKFLEEAYENRRGATSPMPGAEAEMEMVKSQQEEEMKVTPLGVRVPMDQPNLLEGAPMRDYQMDGFRWLKMVFEGAINGILADEMGLGKTIQSIAMICHLYETGIAGPFLIVGPLSTLPNWMIEFDRFAPKVPVLLFHGTKHKRLSLRSQLKQQYDLGARKVFPVVLTSYEVPVIEEKFLAHFNWKYLIVDEAHRLKNSETKLYMVLSSLRTMNRLLLTGTPLQNNLRELWSLLHFILPDIFDNLDTFESWFQIDEFEKRGEGKTIAEERESKIITLLHQILSPFLLRRVKTEVNLKLPGKKEVHVKCPMTKLQGFIYSAIIKNTVNKKMKEKEREELDLHPCKRLRTADRRKNLLPVSGEEPKKSPREGVLEFEFGGIEYTLNLHTTSTWTLLKKVSNHALLPAQELNVSYKRAAARASNPEATLIEESLAASGKLVVLDQLLKKLQKRGHKVLVFSTWKILLDTVEDLVEARHYKWRRLDGSTDLHLRSESISAFNSDPSIFVFLLTTRAGGLGLNLAAADTVIILDSDWNPQADLQAQDRCHRIGQTRPVVIYRMITTGTLDERILSRATAKRKLEKMIIQQGEFSDPKKRSTSRKHLDLDELNEFLSRKQHSLEIEAKDTSGGLTEKEWERLLDRSDIPAIGN